MSVGSAQDGTESLRTIVIAIGANLGVAVAKFGAALVTGSSALYAEAAHALADTGNELVLLVANVRGRRPPDVRHPLGYGREAYFWALIASVGVFVAAAVFSLREGINSLLHPTAASSFAVGYAVLLVSAMFDGVSLGRALQQARAEARRFDHDVLEQLVVTSDPTLRAVFVEDAAAVIADGIAFVGLLLNQITGSPTPDAIAAIMIGVLVAAAAWQLARRNRDFLLGEPVPSEVRARIAQYLMDYPGIVGIRELLVTFVGPHQAWVLARIDVDDALRGNQVEELVRAVEAGLRTKWSPYIARADIVPVGEEAPPGERHAQ